MTVETEPMAKVAKRLQRQSRMHPLATPWIYIAALHERLTANKRSKQRVWVVAVAITFAALRFWVGEHYGDGDSDVARSASRNKVHSPFMLPPVPAPVPETMDAFVLDNHPVSPWRPQRQFWTPIPHQPAPPVFGLATIFQRTPDLSLLQVSYESLRAQSFQRWDWYLIDLRPQPTTLALEDLESFAKLDPRIKVVRREGLKTLTDGRNAALDLFRSSGALYASFLQPNALLELTMLEKAAWTLATVTDWDMVGFFEAQFGASRAVYHHGIHSGARNLNESLIPEGTAFRVAAIAPCRFEEDAPTEKASLWSFWLCFAERGRWGGSLPEIGYWHREDVSTIQKRHLHDAHDENEREFAQLAAPTLSAEPARFPTKEPPRSFSLESISWQPPFENAMLPQYGKSVMIIQSWLLVGGSEVGFLDILRKFAEAGFRVTMVLTRFKYPEGVALRSRVAAYTHDIHFLPSFLRMHDFPRYIKYLIDSRGVDTVFMSNSLLIYEILPSLAEVTPKTRWIDYLHNEAYDGWKNDGFPSLALASRRYLDRTITCSNHLREFMIERGYPAERIGVVKLGINTTRFDEITEEERAIVKTTRLGIPEDTIVIAASARLDNQKRPWLIPDIIRNVVDRINLEKPPGVGNVVMLMMGEGPLRGAVEERIRANSVGDNVRLLGTVDEPETVLRGTDIFLLPSAIEGISVAIAEAMAMGIPIITSYAGGLPEQLGYLKGSQAIAGRLVDLSGNETAEVEQFAEATYDLLKDSVLRRRIGANAAKFVRQTFDQDTTLQGMFRERNIAARMGHPSSKDTPNPAAYFGISEMILEDRVLADLQVTQRRLGEIRKPGKAGELQSKCFVESDDGMRWLDAAAEGKICPGSEKGPNDAAYLYKSASEQCGAWCVWDLRTRSPKGWSFDGQCFNRFDEPGLDCRTWFHLRPNFDFTTLASDDKSVKAGTVAAAEVVAAAVEQVVAAVAEKAVAAAAAAVGAGEGKAA